MENYPSLENQPGTPNYDDVLERIVEKFTNGHELDPAEKQMLFEAHPEWREVIQDFGDDSHAA